MRLLRVVPPDTNINFIGFRWIGYGLSIVLILVSIGAFLTQGLNLGIDFRGGILIEARTEGPADIAALRADLESLPLGEVQLQTFGAPDDILIRVQQQEGDEAAQAAAVDLIKQTLGERIVEYRRTEYVGPTVGAELIESAIWAMSLALVAIMVYVWLRFEWQFGVAAVVALAHDVITTIGLFAVTQLEFNLTTVAAVLTIAGYSINDTVVIFDRVREELRRYKKMPLPALLNLATNQTLSRTFLTSFTTLLALLALVSLGGAVIRDFAIAMIWGVVVGTYSTLLVAVPFVLALGISRTTLSAGKEDEADPKGRVSDTGD